MKKREQFRLSRRELLKAGGICLGGAALCGSKMFGPTSVFGAQCYSEAFPISPLILSPFVDPLPIPKALRPVDPRTLNPTPDPGPGRQDSDGGTHQVWPSVLGLPAPIVYHIKLQVGTHKFTSSKVLPIDANGNPVTLPLGAPVSQNADGTVSSLPDSVIYGFNGTFPGPMINCEYGKPVLVRFENRLGDDITTDVQDFGAPDRAFLTHQHNGHTAPECDGNPHYKPDAYQPGEWVDNMYLMYPAGNDPREKQSFLWFHDHRMDHTGANVYKGMVGLMPHYDPGVDFGDERFGLRLPGVRTDNPDGSFDVKYDIPLALYDCRLDDGIVVHDDCHKTVNPRSHPEWWGKSFFQHFPNHGFVGDIFTVNGTAYPVLQVEPRKYRFRFLDASIARIYRLKLMQGTVTAAPGTQGQFELANASQAMKFTQIASEGGLLPTAIERDWIEIWPAKRREVIVDFSHARVGDVIYLTNVCKMSDGRKPDDVQDPNYNVPVLKFEVINAPRGQQGKDNSIIPSRRTTLRALPPVPSPVDLAKLPHRTFTLERGGGFGGEVEWLINGLPFDPLVSLADVKLGSAEVWTIQNGGGGWVHPLHLHMEEHQVLARNGVPPPDTLHPDDRSKEDVVALEPGESVEVYRKFRTFLGNYVAHCHNLAHEDHAMMFGWKIVP